MEKHFKGKKIMEAGEECLGHMGKYPVIFLPLKPAKQPAYGMVYENFVYGIYNEFGQCRYVMV